MCCLSLSGIPCASYTGADGTCRKFKYCWVSYENPLPPIANCTGAGGTGEDVLVCCPDERPLRPIEQSELLFSSSLL